MRLFPTGVTVITALTESGPNGMTANAVTSLSLEPLLMLACFERDARTLGAVRGSGCFGINVLAAGQQELAERFATKEPEPAKWEGVSWTERAGLPVLDGALVWVGCELRELVEGGDHLVAIGAVSDVAVGDGDPLVYYRGLYGSVSEAGPLAAR